MCRTRTPARTAKIIDALLAQDYVSGLFVDGDIGDLCRHAAAVFNQHAGQGPHATARNRGQFPLIRDRIADSP